MQMSFSTHILIDSTMQSCGKLCLMLILFKFFSLTTNAFSFRKNIKCEWRGKKNARESAKWLVQIRLNQNKFQIEREKVPICIYKRMKLKSSRNK